MKTLKGFLLKFIILTITFITIVSLYFMFKHKPPSDFEAALDVATLPVITTNYNGLELNALHGYTNEMEAQYMRDVITPLNSNGKLDINIYRYDNTIVSISYQIKSLDTTKLIEDRVLDNLTVDSSTTTAALDISSLPNSDEEYLLIIKLSTEKHENVYYYSRIVHQSKSDIKEQIEFVNGFSTSTLDDEAFKNYISNLEISASRDNSNLADVDLQSTFNNLTWGNMEVERVSEPYISITEISGDISCFLLKYKVRAKNDYDTYQYYNVTEFFRVKIGINITYLYVYDRAVEQIFDPTSQNISSTRINLGLDSDLKLKYKTNSTGSFVSFVKDGSLWSMDMKKNEIISIFSFEDMEVGDVRMEYDQFDIEIISTDSDGNTLFLVYGYMEKGGHEGQVGVALYNYTRDDNTLKELVFVPSTKPFSIIKDSVGKFAYLTDNNILYFMIGNSIYTVTMDNNEYIQLATNLNAGNYISNESNNIIAWHENTSINNAESIRVFDVEGHRDYKITAEEGEYIKVIGFIENDLVYGVANKSDVYTDANGKTIFPMYKINVNIYNEEEPDETSVETYFKENIYISSVSITNNILDLTRISKDASGNFVSIDNDKWVNKTASHSNIIEISTISTNLKKKELILNFAYTITSSDNLSLSSPETVTFTPPNKLNLNDGININNLYYVYAYGKMMANFEDAKQAIEYANTHFGQVIKADGNIIWAKLSRPDLAKLTDTTALVEKKYTTLDDILNDSDYKVLNLTGTNFSNVLYYGIYDIPVITHTQNLGYVILSAYSSYYGKVDTVAFTSLTTGEITKMSYTEAVSAVEASGNIFLVLK